MGMSLHEQTCDENTRIATCGETHPWLEVRCILDAPHYPVGPHIGPHWGPHPGIGYVEWDQ